MLADRRVQRFDIGVVQRGGDILQRRRVRQLLDRKALLAERLGQLLAPALDRVDASFTGEPLPDLRARLRRAHELQPVA